MPNNKKKSLESIKGKQAAHPYSRKAQQIRRALHPVSKSAASKHSKHSLITDRILFFKFAIDPEIGCLENHDQVVEICSLWLHRHSLEIIELQENRPKSNRLLLLQTLQKSDLAEYAANGIQMPDLSCPDNVKRLRAWEGDYNGIHLIKMTTTKCPSHLKLEADQLVKKKATQEANRIENISKRQSVPINDDADE